MLEFQVSTNDSISCMESSIHHIFVFDSMSRSAVLQRGVCASDVTSTSRLRSHCAVCAAAHLSHASLSLAFQPVWAIGALELILFFFFFCVCCSKLIDQKGEYGGSIVRIARALLGLIRNADRRLSSFGSLIFRSVCAYLCLCFIESIFNIESSRTTRRCDESTVAWRWSIFVRGNYYPSINCICYTQ